MTDLLQRIEGSIQNRRLISRGDKILVAVSGGLDSMVLLCALKSLSARNKWKIVAAHFNHRLRGRASDADEKLVRQTAKQLKMPVVVESADVKSFARQSKLSIEMAARKLRHEFFARAARREKIKTIALAHHAGDQVELFFVRLLRGAGSEGLAGMKWKSPSPADRAISLVRPLLALAKSELEEFARENRIPFRHDATNDSPDFLRNRIRHGLLPLIEKNYQPAVVKTILRLMEILGAESDFIGETARRAAKSNFENLPPAIQRRVLQLRLAGAGIAADFDLIESLRQTPEQFVSVGANISVARTESGEIKMRTESEPEFLAGELPVKLAGRAGEAIFGGAKFQWRFSGSAGVPPASSFDFPPAGRRRSGEMFDADKIGGEIILRHWRPGDRFQPIGLKSPVKLQDLFTNAKIPRERRRQLILATTTAGEIFWVEGLRISETFKITPATKRHLIWHCKKMG